MQSGGDYGWNDGRHALLQPGKRMRYDRPHPADVRYDHTQGEAVIGGYVYRGSAIPSLVGAYIFGDNGSGTISNCRRPAGHMDPHPASLHRTQPQLVRQDVAGEIYVVDYSGSVLKLTAQ